MRKIKLITNCERSPNWLMDIAIKHWLASGFKPEDMIFLVNNITNFDLVEELRVRYGFDAKRIDSINDIYQPDKCVVWDDLEEYDYGKYHDLEAPIINKVQHKLLKAGVDVVIFLDRDEILWYDGPGGLMELLNTFKKEVLRPRGVEVIQAHGEAPFDINKTVAEQRKWCRWYPSKSKACITRIPVDWVIGRHGTTCGRWPHADTIAHPSNGGDVSEHPGLYLVHFDKVDIDLLYELRLESQRIFETNNRHTGVVDPLKYILWFLEAHKETIPERKLYDCGDFLYRVGV